MAGYLNKDDASFMGLGYYPLVILHRPMFDMTMHFNLVQQWLCHFVFLWLYENVLNSSFPKWLAYLVNNK